MSQRTITKDDIAAIRARAAAALPGPWHWGGNTDVHNLRLTAPEGRNGRRGLYEVMGFKRWGMQNAQPMFLNLIEGGHWLKPASEMAIYDVAPDATERTDRRVYRADVIGIRHPDAEFIAHSRQDVDTLLEYIEQLETTNRVQVFAELIEASKSEYPSQPLLHDWLCDRQRKDASASEGVER